MSAIHFEADLDNKKLNSAIKESQRTIKDWAKDVEKSGGQVDKSFDKTAKNFKNTIREQKELIKSIEKDVKDLQKTYDDATAGRAKQAAGTELRAAKKALAEEQASLIELQKQQIDANEQESSGINKLVGSISKWFIGLASVGAALKIAKGIIDSSTDATLKFHQITAGASAGVQYFFKTISSGDWSNFFGGMAHAIEGAAEFVEKMEELENFQNEIRVRSSKYDIEIAKYREDTFDKEDSNNDIRLNALTEIIRLTKLKYSEEADYQTKLYAAQLKNAADLSGVEEDKIERFITEYSSLEDMLKIGKEYNKLQKLMYSPGITNKFLNEIQRQVDALGPGAKQAGEYANQISKVTMEVRKGLSTTLAARQEAESKAIIGSRRDEMQRAQLENKIENDKKEAIKATIEAAKIENKLKKEQELLNKAIDKGNEAEIKAISTRIVKLQEELALKEKLTEQALGAAIVRGEPISKVSISGIPTLSTKVSSVLAGAPKYSAKKLTKEEEESLKKELELRKKIVSEAVEFTSELISQLNLSEAQAKKILIQC